MASTKVSNITAWLSTKLDRTRAILERAPHRQEGHDDSDDPAHDAEDVRPRTIRTSQPTLVIGIDGGEYRERDQEAVIVAKEDAPLHTALMAEVVDHLEDDVDRCEHGQGPQPDVRGRDEQGASQDDRHDGAGDEIGGKTPMPVL